LRVWACLLGIPSAPSLQKPAKRIFMRHLDIGTISIPGRAAIPRGLLMPRLGLNVASKLLRSTGNDCGNGIMPATLNEHECTACRSIHGLPRESKSVITGDLLRIRLTATNLAPSSCSRPRDAENRDRLRSAQPPNASSKLADRSQPASNQQTAPTCRDFPGSREAGSHQLHGIGPYNGRCFRPDSGPGRSKMETASLQPGSRSTASNPASSAAWRPRRADRIDTRNPLAMAPKPHRFGRRKRQQRNQEAIATWRPDPGSRQADAIQA